MRIVITRSTPTPTPYGSYKVFALEERWKWETPERIWTVLFELALTVSAGSSCVKSFCYTINDDIVGIGFKEKNPGQLEDPRFERKLNAEKEYWTQRSNYLQKSNCFQDPDVLPLLKYVYPGTIFYVIDGE